MVGTAAMIVTLCFSTALSTSVKGGSGPGIRDADELGAV